MTERAIGILGGMGPEATVDIFSKIIKSNPVAKDQDQLRIIVYCNSKIPNRRQAISYQAGGKALVRIKRSSKEDPRPEMIRTAKILETSGAGLIIIACNTAHFFYEDIQKNVSVPVLHTMQEVAKRIRLRMQSLKTVGVLAGPIVTKAGLYQKPLEKIGLRVLCPDTDEELGKIAKCVNEIKGGNKSKEVKQFLVNVAEKMVRKGAQAVILGCTEFPLVVQEGDLSVPALDANQLLAEAAIEMAKAEN